MAIAFTLSSPVKPNTILSEITIFHPDNTKDKKQSTITALWDTGATISCITKKIATELELIPIDKTIVNHAAGQSVVNVYIVTIILPNKLIINDMLVCEAELRDNEYSMLIGMDVINLGDLAITHEGGGSKVSYQYPSSHDIDFVEEIKSNDEKQRKKIPRNAPCPCGSGKKYKQCCMNKPKL